MPAPSKKYEVILFDRALQEGLKSSMEEDIENLLQEQKLLVIRLRKNKDRLKSLRTAVTRLTDKLNEGEADD